MATERAAPPGLFSRLRRTARSLDAETERRYRELVEASGAILCEVAPPDFSVQYISPAAESLLGLPPAAWLGDGDGWKRLLHSGDAERLLTTMRLALHAGQPFEELVRGLKADGQVVWLHCTGRVTPLDAPRPRLLMTFTDVTHAKLAEANAQENERRVRVLLDELGDILLVHDMEGRIIEANRTACDALGYARADLLELRVQDVQLDFELERAQAVWRALEAGRSVTVEAEYRRRDSFTFPVEIRLGLVQWPGQALVSVIARDSSERRHLEQQLRQSQKMEAVGRLAGGVAHDFNNLLTAIKGHAALLLDGEVDNQAKSDLMEITRAADRAAVLTRKLLAFSRQQIFAPETLDLNRIVLDASRLLRPLLGESIDFRTELGRVGRVIADHGQIEQVLVNLVVNARDALTQGGQLTIATENLDVDEARPWRHGFVRQGGYALLRVTDTGHGMDERTIARIFEPFFTTKEKGRGSGLGLSIAYGIIKQSGGYLIAESEPGRGSTFLVLLPRKESDGAAPGAGAQREPGNGRVVLVVEDEAPVRSLVCRVLEREGYLVLQATTGEEALLQARSFEGRLDLVLCDMVLPGMDGQQLTRVLCEERPETRAILLSGYRDESEPVSTTDSGVTIRMDKPFTPAELLRRLQEILGE